MLWFLTSIAVAAGYLAARSLEPRCRPWVRRLGSGWACGGLGAANAALAGFFAWRFMKFEEQGCGALDFDARFGYSPEEVAAALEVPAGCRRFYAASQVTADVVFPLLYLLLMGVTLAWLAGRHKGGAPPWVRFASPLPVAMACLDLVENLLLAGMAAAGSVWAPAVWVASAATRGKWLFAASVLLALGTLVSGLLVPRILAPPSRGSS